VRAIEIVRDLMPVPALRLTSTIYKAAFTAFLTRAKPFTK